MNRPNHCNQNSYGGQNNRIYDHNGDRVGFRHQNPRYDDRNGTNDSFGNAKNWNQRNQNNGFGNYNNRRRDYDSIRSNTNSRNERNFDNSNRPPANVNHEYKNN